MWSRGVANVQATPRLCEQLKGLQYEQKNVLKSPTNLNRTITLKILTTTVEGMAASNSSLLLTSMCHGQRLMTFNMFL